MPELLLVVAEFLTEEEERRPAPEEIADSLRVDPARPLLKELEDEGLVVDPEFLKEEDRKSTRLNSSHDRQSRMPSSA